MKRLQVSPNYDFPSVLAAVDDYHRQVNKLAFSDHPPARPYEPMEYFRLFRHLRIQGGWKLNYLDDSSPNGAPHLVFQPLHTNIPGVLGQLREFRSLDVVVESGSGQIIPRRLDLTDFLTLDGTPESVLELALFATFAGQCMLRWHANYRDEVIVPETSWRPTKMMGMGAEPPDPPEGEAGFNILDCGDFLAVRFLLFTHWGGYHKAEFRVPPDYSANISVTNRVVLHFSCGVLF